jgi:hypothetical protein
MQNQLFTDISSFLNLASTSQTIDIGGALAGWGW